MTPFDVEDDDFEDCLDEGEERTVTAGQLSDEALRHTAAIADMMSAND